MGIFKPLTNKEIKLKMQSYDNKHVKIDNKLNHKDKKEKQKVKDFLKIKKSELAGMTAGEKYEMLFEMINFLLDEEMKD